MTSINTHSARAWTMALGFVLLSFVPGSGEAAQLPILPQVVIDTTYSPPPGNTLTVNAGGSLQTALNNAQPGDTIILQAGASFTGTFTLPNKSGSGWIYVRSSNYSSLPAPGNRVSPSDAANMPKIVGTSSGGSALVTASGAHHFRFVGIEFKPAAGQFIYSLIDIGNNETSVSALPHDITFDRCYIHGDPSVGGRRGIAMNGAAIAVVDSHVSDFKESGADTQALWAFNSPGPFKIVNNHLEAAGENVMFGGAAPAIYNVLPSDIEIRRNHFFKPLSWVGSSWTIKNLLEFKLGKRVLVEGNIFENNWQAAQNGFSILLTPRNEDGTAPWAATQDVTIRYNRGINLGQGFNISGEDDVHSSQRTTRVLIKDNLMQITSLNGSQGRSFGVVHGPTDLTIDHNTVFTNGTMAFVENSPLASSFVFTNNIVDDGDYGFVGTGTQSGTPTLNGHFSGYTFTKNAVIAYWGEPYPSGNYFPSTQGAVGFVSLSGGDYHLAATSPYKGAGLDGKDLGADIDALTAAMGASGYVPGPTALLPPTNLRVF